MRSAMLIFAVASALPMFASGVRAGRAAAKIVVSASAPVDGLFVKALVIEAGDKRAALVVCDLQSIDSALASAARRAVTEATGMQPEQIMISTTNTHAAPDAASIRASLPVQIGEAVAEAARSLTPVTLSRAVGTEDSVSHYRRYLMKDGTAQLDPGKRNPETVQPMGETDPDLAMIHFAPVAIYLNYAMRPESVRGPGYSADYPAPLAKLLGKVFGKSTLALFTLGAAANVNHIDVKSASPQKGIAEAVRLGTVLGGEAIKTSARLQPLEAKGLRFARESVRLPSRAKKAAENEAEVQVIAIDDQIAWVALPGEVYVELGRAIKKASPFPVTIVVTLANGDLGVIPTAKAYKEGGEDVAGSAVAPGGGEMLAEAAIRLLAGAHRAAR
ncbi:MAG: hypothetical protein R2762_12010 [Bryobacteraceae bacterium]